MKEEWEEEKWEAEKWNEDVALASWLEFLIFLRSAQ